MALTYEPISTTTLGTSSTINITSIPSTYTDLRLVVTGNDTTGGSTFGIRVNGLSASVIYSSFYGYASSTTTGYTYNTVSTILKINGGGANGTALAIIDFSNYSSTSIWKGGSANACSYGSTASMSLAHSSFLIQTTQAISSIFIGSGSGSTLVAGTTATLFGIKAA